MLPLVQGNAWEPCVSAQLNLTWVFWSQALWLSPSTTHLLAVWLSQLHLSVSQPLHLQNSDNDNTYLTELWSGLNELALSSHERAWPVVKKPWILAFNMNRMW